MEDILLQKIILGEILDAKNLLDQMLLIRFVSRNFKRRYRGSFFTFTLFYFFYL